MAVVQCLAPAVQPVCVCSTCRTICMQSEYCCCNLFWSAKA